MLDRKYADDADQVISFCYCLELLDKNGRSFSEVVDVEEWRKGFDSYC